MTREQIQCRGMILADLHVVYNNANSSNKYEKSLAAYHMQQAIEKTIKLKADIEGVNLWGHNISYLIKQCDLLHININVPSLIRKNARMYTTWEAGCRYVPVEVVNKNSIWAAYRVTVAWLNSGNTVK